MNDLSPQAISMLIPIVALTGSGVVLGIWIIMRGIRRSVEARAFEQSRREIAAYIAEGSMSAQDGATILAVQSTAKAKDPAKRIAMHLQLGSINKHEAKVLAAAREGVSESTWAEMVDLCIRGLPVDEAVKLARTRSGPAPAGQAVPAAG